ncbi:hypothetical protein ACQR1W_00570 [Bradyrhizobium sp. HKCCYLS1011]|uniref:hypothetical protein n=1 Tax=Bradyrhizobium sp. HKCCYLS1011 TaxID=3420733 RepID=UPI003EB97EE8
MRYAATELTASLIESLSSQQISGFFKARFSATERPCRSICGQTAPQPRNSAVAGPPPNTADSTAFFDAAPTIGSIYQEFRDPEQSHLPDLPGLPVDSTFPHPFLYRSLT